MRLWNAALILVVSAGCSTPPLSPSASTTAAPKGRSDADWKRLESELVALRADNRALKQSLAVAHASAAESPSETGVALPLRPGDEKLFAVTGNLIKVSHVVFAPAGFEIAKSEALDVLGRWAERLAQPDVSLIIVEGHTDSDPVNQARSSGVQNNAHLSVLRAAVVANRLIQAGVPEQKVVISGHGARNPVDVDRKEANRRVEIRIFGKTAPATAPESAAQPLK